MKKQQKRKVKRHIKWKAFFLLFVVLFFIGYFFYCLINLPIKHVLITGNTLIKDYEIMEATGLKEYPKLMKYSAHTIEKKIENMDLVNQVKVKKNIFGKVTITIDEAKVLFYNRNTEAYVLSNGKETTNGEFPGVPFLINYVQSDVYTSLITELTKVKPEILSLVSEIQYDTNRFLLRMNDGSIVFVDLLHMESLNNYKEYYSVKTNQKYLFLDTEFNFRWSPYPDR